MPSDYKEICQDNIRRRGQEFDDIGHLISTQLYGDRSHFVYELLQNAEDALERRFRLNPNDNSPYKVQFKLFPDRLEFRHFGALFNEEDVRGISDVLRGTKKEDFDQIGKFGIGFKSVYAFTASPEIHSGEEHFVIKRYIRPEAKECDLSITECETVFNFPFDHKELIARNAFGLIYNKLRGLRPRTLLFLRRINEIEWGIEPNGEKGQYLKEVKKVKNIKNARRVTVIGQNNNEDENENWLIFERAVSAPDGSYQVKVEIGFRLETSTKDETEVITGIAESPLVVYFPTEKATRFGFLIQGPYRTTPSRDNIYMDDWNKTLARETAQLLTDVLPELKVLGLFSVSLLEALPIRMIDFSKDSMFYPIVEAVRNSLMNEDLLPADDGTFVSGRNTKLARGADLRKLLNQDQLGQLFESNNKIKWLTGEITQDRKPDLRTYLLNELRIEEVTPDIFARKVTQSFLTIQSDHWFVDFYEYLSGQEALWRSPRWAGDTTGLLRFKPILRLQDNSQEVPFQPDGKTPNVFLPPPEETDFPIVKRTIVTNEQVMKFLNRLGLSEPDVFDDIVEKVLPRYTKQDVSSISQNEHSADIQRILRALHSDSEAGKKKVIRATSQTPFIKAVDQNGNTAFQKPVDIYFPTQELTEYFQGSSDVWFLNEPEGEEEWREIGVENKPRFKRIMIDLPLDEKKKIIGNQRHTRDILTTDYQLHGLENFLSRFPEKIKLFGNYSLILWNFLLEHFKEVAYSRFYQGEYKWFYYQVRSATFDANWKKLIHSHAWLPKNSDNVPHLPSELRIVDLPDEFNPDDRLADLLGMKKDDVAILAERAGIHVEDIELMKQHQEEFQRWKKEITARKDPPAFPTKKPTDPERREKKIIEKYKKATKKDYKKVLVPTKTTDAKTWLNETYKNDAGELICQICKKVMPFKKRDGNYYFEAVEIIKKLDREMEELHVALCPLCAAMYNEFVKLDESVMENLYDTLKNSDDFEVPLKLGDLITSIQFVESHFLDIRTILKTKGESGVNDRPYGAIARSLNGATS